MTVFEAGAILKVNEMVGGLDGDEYLEIEEAQAWAQMVDAARERIRAFRKTVRG